MSVISEYTSRVQKTIGDLPFVLYDNLNVDNRGDVVLYLKGEILFTNYKELHFKEYLTSVSGLKKIAYSYHYQDGEKKMIFRYDNAEHHPELKHFPYHKHIGNQTVSSEEISLDEVLEIIITEMFSSFQETAGYCFVSG